MKSKLTKVGRKLLGKKLYNDLRARRLFRDLESPFPLFQETPFQMDWDSYESVENLTNVAYIVSPTQRSGTNYLSHMLNMHPDLTFPAGDNLPDEQCLYTYSESIKEYAYNTVSTWSKWVEGGDRSLITHSKGLVSAMGEGVLNYFKRFTKPGATLLFKTPDAGHLENVFHLFGGGKVVLLIRDGRDTLESFSKSWGGDGAFGKMSERWSNRVDTILKFKDMAERSGRGDKLLFVRYDELNNNTNHELSVILDFLGVSKELFPWNELKNVPVLGSSAHKTKDDVVHWNPIEKNEGFNPNKKWLMWTEKKKNIFKKAAGDNLIRLGFAESNDW
ncbi:sulfotransferase [Fulvivirga sp.]|uniref:sulfotransferase n=1 Tax=Fulvivirga sp. TaxID=1931237 RepID=UPI0032EF6B3F